MSIVLAWIGLALGLGVLAVVGDLLYRIMRPLQEIKRNVDETFTAGVGIARNLDGADELERTRELIAELGARTRRLAGEVVGK